jgi:hypothetical protein
MTTKALKFLLPNHPVPTRIWRGPFRGARVVMNPRNSMRKIFGLYEHELNAWLEQALRRVNRVLDVGANDGYFTFGCAAAFHRLGKSGEIIAIEPQDRFFQILQQSVESQPSSGNWFTLIHGLVGDKVEADTITLDSLHWKRGTPNSRSHTLVKIDVEGAEMEVLAGSISWLNSSNCFLIEVHKEIFLGNIKQLFKNKGLILDQVDQRPLRLVGGEFREEQNWWLVSRLGST